MGNISSKNEFPVDGKTIVITGGSRGMGKEVGRQLSEKGANIVIIARDVEKLLQAIEYIQEGAINPQIQRFHHISADLSSPDECVRVIDEVEWNRGVPPDTVWCCAGSSYPTLFIDTPVSQLQSQINSNYLTSAYIAHATLRSWLKPLEERKERMGDKPHDSEHTKNKLPPQLVISSSLLPSSPSSVSPATALIVLPKRRCAPSQILSLKK